MMDSSPLVGTCLTMCPVAEIRLREAENLVHPFEVLHGPCPQRRKAADPSRMVKEYSRPTVGKREATVSDLRPPHVLTATVDYLIDRVAGQNVPWSDRYDFLFNRLRSIRQDLVIQDWHGPETLDVLEKCVRFHLLSDYRLCTEQPAVFDQKINNQHTQECLKRLLNLYEASQTTSLNRVQFETIYLLFNLGDADALKHFYSLRKEYRHCRDLHLAYRISIACLHSNWVRTVRLIHQLDEPLYLCAVHQHFPAIWRKALSTMSSGYSSKVLVYPLARLTALLGLNTDTETQGVCERLGLAIHGTAVQLLKGACNTSQSIARQHCDFITSRLRVWSVPDILHGRTHREWTGEDILPSGPWNVDHLTDSFNLLQS